MVCPSDDQSLPEADWSSRQGRIITQIYADRSSPMYQPSTFVVSQQVLIDGVKHFLQRSPGYSRSTATRPSLPLVFSLRTELYADDPMQLGILHPCHTSSSSFRRDRPSPTFKFPSRPNLVGAMRGKLLEEPRFSLADTGRPLHLPEHHTLTWILPSVLPPLLIGNIPSHTTST